jgi:hypothetical protein
VNQTRHEAHDALDIDLDRVWTGIAAETLAEQPGAVERFAAWALHSPGLARAIVTTPSLVMSWLIATAVVLGVGVLATAGSGEPWFALVAPVLAGIGVAYAYGPGIDPAFELTQTMAVSDRMILLARVLVIFGQNALAGVLATLVTASAAGMTFGWLLPMTTVAAIALAASTLAQSANVGVGAAVAGWALIVLGTAYDAGNLLTAVEPNRLTYLVPVYLLMTLCFGFLAYYATSGRYLSQRL